MAHVKNHDYHILNPSLWPLLGAVAAFVMLFGATVAMKGETTILGGMITISGPWMGLIGFVGVLYVMFGWWADTVTEKQSGRPYTCCFDRPALWFHPVHHVRGDVLLCMVLVIL